MIEGMENIRKRFQELSNPDKIADNMGLAVALVEREAKKKAKKVTGELRRSIESKVEIKDKEVVGTVFSALEYAPYVEYGTGLFAEKGGRTDVPWNYKDDKGQWHRTNGQAPQPFMRPALDENREEIKEIISEGFKND